ncbi:hypothetical protein IKG12_02875 [Candidatus Saccharibacteria bacterium]|nr:hypothetical protein [Candidatus Saccharibacteria bacterium]
MDNNMQPFAPQPSSRPDNVVPNPNQNQNTAPSSPIDSQIPPAMPQGYQPAQTAPLSAQQGQPMLNNTGVTLESPILEPTHFDGMQNPNLPNQPIGSATKPGATQLSPEQQKTKMFVTLSIVFGALAFIGIILGIWSLVSNIDTSNKLKQTQDQLGIAQQIIGKIEEDTGVTITSVDTVPEYVAVPGNIYITEWGIKFKIPDDLENVSYTLDQKYRPQICFAAHKTGIKYFPAFADIDQNPRGVGCVTRVASYEGDSDKDTGISFGQKIYSYGDYNYFYNAPEGHFSQDAAEQGLEDTAAQIVKNMISNNISNYQ